MRNSFHVKVPAGPEGARVARQQLAGLEREVGREVLDNLRLMVSELVTNSIRHAGLAEGTRIAGAASGSRCPTRGQGSNPIR